MNLTDDSDEGRIQIAWDHKMAAAKHARTRDPLAMLIRYRPSLVPGLDAKKLAALINGTLQVSSKPNSDPDIYESANRGEWGPLCDALKELVEAGGFVGLLELADFLAVRRGPGQPEFSKLKGVMRDDAFHLAVTEAQRTNPKLSPAKAIRSVAKAAEVSVSTVKRAHRRHELRTSLTNGVVHPEESVDEDSPNWDGRSYGTF